MFVRMFARWFIHTFINSTPKVLKKAAKNSGIDNVDNETRVQVESSLFHE